MDSKKAEDKNMGEEEKKEESKAKPEVPEIGERTSEEEEKKVNRSEERNISFKNTMEKPTDDVTSNK
jgi:hypothetical protein